MSEAKREEFSEETKARAEKGQRDVLANCAALVAAQAMPGGVTVGLWRSFFDSVAALNAVVEAVKQEARDRK